MSKKRIKKSAMDKIKLGNTREEKSNKASLAKKFESAEYVTKN